VLKIAFSRYYGDIPYSTMVLYVHTVHIHRKGKGPTNATKSIEFQICDREDDGDGDIEKYSICK
jgi:hypothetical protein